MQKPITQRVKGTGGQAKTLPTVTVTAKKKSKPMKPESSVYIIGEQGRQNKQVTKSEYDKYKGPKISMKKDDPRLKTLGTQGGKPTTIPGGYIKKKP
jgi:hypothetical protein